MEIKHTRTMNSLHIFNGTQGLRLDDAGAQELLGILLKYFNPPAPWVVRVDEAGALADMVWEIMRGNDNGDFRYTFDQALQIAKLHFQLKGAINGTQITGDGRKSKFKPD